MQRWFPGKTTLLEHIDWPTHSSITKAEIRFIAQGVRAFRQGRACSMISWQWRTPRRRTRNIIEKDALHRHVSFSGAKLAWILNEEGDWREYALQPDLGGLPCGIVIKDLFGGPCITVEIPNRQKVVLIALSESLVGAVLYSGRCFISSFGQERWDFRLPSSNIVHFSCHHRVFAVVLKECDSRMTVILYYFDTKSSRSFSLDVSEHSQYQRVLIHPLDGSVILFGSSITFGFALNTAYEKRVHLYYGKYSIRGDLLSEGCLQHRLGFGTSKSQWRIYPSDYHSRYTIYTGIRPKYPNEEGLDYSYEEATKNDPPWEFYRVQFDTKSDAFVFDAHSSEGYDDLHSTNRRHALYWKDVVYSIFDPGSAQGSLRISNLSDGTSKLAELSILGISRLSEHSGNACLYGNEKVLIRVDENECDVWYFDKNIVVPGQNIGFSTERVSRARTRAEERRKIADALL
ncbi:MAG: hypothetical protein M1827_005838 [Pycnora praestabilis]|nr:MAG: hypothetical protein M1827_005838 [Pycnora praestabilis]